MSTPQNSILNSFKNEFSSAVNVIHVNSLDMDVKFREVTVIEQKNLSKTMIENEDRKDIVYTTQCDLINRLCIDKIPRKVIDQKTNEETVIYDNFDIYDLTEFDRIRILAEIYKNNYFKNTIEYTCKECGQHNKYVLDFSKIIAKFNEFDLKDVTYYLEDDKHKFNFVINYPSVRAVSEFYKSYMKKYKGTTKKQQEVLDSLGNIDYINLFIKSAEYISKEDPTKREKADFTVMSYSDIEQLISYFPQNIIFSEENGVLKFIAQEFISKLNNVFAYEKCAFCGAESHEGMGNVVDFF